MRKRIAAGAAAGSASRPAPALPYLNRPRPVVGVRPVAYPALALIPRAEPQGRGRAAL
jgi:hypothetical protein